MSRLPSLLAPVFQRSFGCTPAPLHNPQFRNKGKVPVKKTPAKLTHAQKHKRFINELSKKSKIIFKSHHHMVPFDEEILKNDYIAKLKTPLDEAVKREYSELATEEWNRVVLHMKKRMKLRDEAMSVLRAFFPLAYTKMMFELPQRNKRNKQKIYDIYPGMDMVFDTPVHFKGVVSKSKLQNYTPPDEILQDETLNISNIKKIVS